MTICACGRTLTRPAPRCDRCLALRALGLESTVAPDEIKQAYRTLAKAWHPDRFHSGDQQRKEAEARFSEINAAYQYLTSNPADPIPSPPPRRPAPPPANTAPRRPAPPSHDPSRPTEWLGETWKVVTPILVLVLLVGAKYFRQIFTPAPTPPRAFSSAVPLPRPEPRRRPARDPNADTLQYLQSHQNDQALTPATPDDRYLDGLYAGSVHDATDNLDAKAEILLSERGNHLSGCLVVFPPLHGSAPLTGVRETSGIRLTASSRSFRTVLSAQSSPGALAGGYLLHRAGGADQQGQFSLARADGARLPGRSNHCPSDTEVAHLAEPAAIP